MSEGAMDGKPPTKRGGNPMSKVAMGAGASSAIIANCGKKALSWLLTAAMVLTLLPIAAVPAYAATAHTVTEGLSFGEGVSDIGPGDL